MRPNLIISVPLILEKVYRKQILPQITSPRIKRLLALPIVRGQIYKASAASSSRLSVAASARSS